MVHIANELFHLRLSHAQWKPIARSKSVEDESGRLLEGPPLFVGRSQRLSPKSFKVKLHLDPRNKDFMLAHWEWMHANIRGRYALTSQPEIDRFYHPTYAFALEADALLAKLSYGDRICGLTF